MDIAALHLCSRFALPPNKLAYCGLDSATKSLHDCITQNKCNTVREEITHFKGLYPYLKTIAEVLNKDYLDYEVVEAYWLGNDSLNKFKPTHYQILIKNLQKQNLPDFFIEEIANRPPKNFIPLHLFNVIHIGVGKITGSVPFNLSSINNCMIRWGKVKAIHSQKGQLQVETLHLIPTSRGDTGGRPAPGRHKTAPYLLQTITKNYSYYPEFLPDLKVGDTIAVHWQMAVKILTHIEEENLKRWTNKVLESLA